MNSLHPTRISGLLGVSLVLPDSQDFFNTLTCPANVLVLNQVVLWRRYLLDWSLYLLWICDRFLMRLPHDTCGMRHCGDSYVLPTPASTNFCTQLRCCKTYLLDRRLGHQTFSTCISVLWPALPHSSMPWNLSRTLMTQLSSVFFWTRVWGSVAEYQYSSLRAPR